MDNLQTIDDVAKKQAVTTPKNIAGIRAEAAAMLPCEKVARERLELATLPKETDLELAARFKPMNMSFLTSCFRKQKGIPISVPRFALQNVLNDKVELKFNYDTDRSVPLSHLREDGTFLPAYSALEGVFAKQIVQKSRVHYLLMFLLSSIFLGGSIWFHFFVKAAANEGIIVASLAAIIVFAITELVTGYGMIWPSGLMSSVEHKLECKFAGVIPANIREVISTEKKNFRSMYILYEAEQWSHQETKIPAKMTNPDPLILGELGGVFYLVSQFDATPAEHWIKSEFGL